MLLEGVRIVGKSTLLSLTTRNSSAFKDYTWHMVSSTLQRSLESLSISERIDVIDFLQRTLVPPFHLTESEKDMVRSRAADMDTDPSIGLTWDELDSHLQSVWG